MSGKAITAPSGGGGGIRKKSAFSCEQCRRRKVKCDGGSPSCGRCASRGEGCVYKLSPSLSYTQTLERRVASLEQALAASPNGGSSIVQDPSAGTPGSSDAVPLAHQTVPSPVTRAPTSSMKALQMDQSGRVSYHGTTSFFQLALNSPKEENPPPAQTADSQGEKERLVNNAWTELAFEKLQSNLPELVQFLLDSHWCWIQPLFNFVYRPAFTRDMNSGGPYCSKLLLNVMLLHSVRWAKADSRLTMLLEPYEGGAFFERQVKAELMAAVSDGPASIPTVQSLLLLSAQECGKGHLAQAWLYSGMAFRLIEDLGITFDGRRYTGSLFTTEDMEIRNRLYWASYWWDKLISLYLGRLPTLQHSSNGPARHILDDTSEIDTWRPHGVEPGLAANYPSMQAHSTTCFIRMCGLSEILNTVLLTFYNPVQERGPAGLKACVADQDQYLAAWYDELPDYLRISTSQVPTHSPPSHIVTLNCLYHTINILLHRPMLTTYNKTGESAEADNMDHLRRCMESATSIVIIFDLYVRSFGDGHVVLSQGYTVYTAASVFLLQVQATRGSPSPATEQLRFCVNALERLKVTSPSKSSSVPALDRRKVLTVVVIEAALALIYKELHSLSLVTAVGATQATPSYPNTNNEQARVDPSLMLYAPEPSYDTGHNGFNFTDFDFDSMQVTSETLNALSELEPISTNVNAGFGMGTNYQPT